MRTYAHQTCAADQYFGLWPHWGQDSGFVLEREEFLSELAGNPLTSCAVIAIPGARSCIAFSLYQLSIVEAKPLLEFQIAQA
jgi:hypothetical protein